MAENTYVIRDSPAAADEVPDADTVESRLVSGLARFVDDLAAKEPGAPGLLRELERALSGAPNAAFPAADWAQLDLFSVFDVEAIARFTIGAEVPGWVRWLEALRNVLIMAPILVTWWAIAVAVRAYQVDLDGGHASEKPFLYLWQSGFDNHLPRFGLTFDALARLDAALVLIVIVLTLGHYALSSSERSQRLVSRCAELRQLLAGASLLLAGHRSQAPQRALERVLLGAERLQEELHDERLRLRRIANENVQVVEELHATAQAFAAGSTAIVESADALKTLHAGAHQRLDAVLTAQERTAASEMDTASRIRSWSDRSEAILVEHRRASHLLGEMFDGVGRRLDGLDAGTAGLAGGIGTLVTAAGKLTTAASTLLAAAELTREAAEGAAAAADRATRAAERPDRGSAVRDVPLERIVFVEAEPKVAPPPEDEPSRPPSRLRALLQALRRQ